MRDAIIRIHPPVLTDEERTRRMNEIRRAAIKVIREADRARIQHHKKEW